MQKFTINTSLPTLNDYIDAERRNKYKAAAMKKNATESVAFFAKAQKLILPKNTMFDVSIRWYRCNARHDSDNVFFGVKFILDGLVVANVLENDNRKFVRNIHHSIETDRKTKQDYCIVELHEAKI